MSYLCAADSIVGIILCGYVFRLARMNRTLLKDVTRLQERLAARDGEE